ncbi:hypothetical protein [Pedobacter yulinensis]|nr:hypothetical protein [Pedobacter yulinensis]
MSKAPKSAPETLAKAPKAQPVNSGTTPAAAKILREQAATKRRKTADADPAEGTSATGGGQ